MTEVQDLIVAIDKMRSRSLGLFFTYKDIPNIDILNQSKLPFSKEAIRALEPDLDADAVRDQLAANEDDMRLHVHHWCTLLCCLQNWPTEKPTEKRGVYY